MKSKITRLLLLIAALVLQYGPVQKLTVFSFSANLCVLALIGVSYFSSPAEAVVYGGVLGMLMDGAAGRRFGVQLILCLYLAAAVKALISEKINNSPALMALYMWPLTSAYYLAYGLLSGAVLRDSVSPGRWLLTGAVTAAINMLLSLPLLWAAEKLTRRRAAHE